MSTYGPIIRLISPRLQQRMAVLQMARDKLPKLPTTASLGFGSSPHE
jgi:hypothetical protein